jgi:hypothetical protein
MQRSMFRLILASLFSMAISIALGADLSRWSQENASVSQDQAGCSCDAPGIVGAVCATPHRCREMDGLCLGSCAQAVEDESGCSCDAPGVVPAVVGKLCATPYRCREMSGLCVGRC